MYRISVILPVFNGMTYLNQSIESVLSQSFTNFELLIIDDCSTDSSWNYIKNIQHPHTTIYKNEINKGLFFNLNFLIKNSKSNLIKLWAQDDVMRKGCLDEVVGFHKRYPEAGFSFSGREIINERGKVTKTFTSDQEPSLISTYHHTRVAFFTGSIAGNIANVCINKEALEEVGGFNESMKMSGDFEMLVRLAEKRPVGFIPKNLVSIREHKGQLSLNADYFLNHVKEDLQIYRILINYSDDALIKEGKKVMRQHKLVFYYTLMLKDFLHGKFRKGFAYYKELSAFDNFFLLTLSFIKAKIKKPAKPAWI